ncbi:MULTISPECIES: lycopene cyclase domain-containing protein [unclassified Salinibacterium]|uniref:lycopene cyclase domain-containing protein n=1 Tax=unclassified Salinibacterium TaxID=2632331 RepID=UPI001421FBF2|nr:MULTISPECIES: lycopene cyclase domain-containing protein [unclassified Salinibacterium]
MIAPYPVLAVAIIVIALVIRLVLGARAARLGHPIPVLPTVVATAILLLLTIIFDNLMIAAGLMRYSPDEISGLLIGLVPIEDLSYPVAVAILMPALWHQPRKAAHE